MTEPDPIVNPLSGEHILIKRTAAQTRGQVLDWELRLAPGGRVPSSHAHPEQEETFTVLEGTMRFRVGWRRITVGPGERVCVPPGTVHHFANAGEITAKLAVESRPALQTQALLETAAAMAREQQSAGRALPRPLDLALFMTDFDGEVRAPFLPRRLVRMVMDLLARMARGRGLDARYRRLRRPEGAGAPADEKPTKPLGASIPVSPEFAIHDRD